MAPGSCTAKSGESWSSCRFNLKLGRYAHILERHMHGPLFPFADIQLRLLPPSISCRMDLESFPARACGVVVVVLKGDVGPEAWKTVDIGICHGLHDNHDPVSRRTVIQVNPNPTPASRPTGLYLIRYRAGQHSYSRICRVEAGTAPPKADITSSS